MSEPASPQPGHGEMSRDETMSALFASMVMQQAQMAMLYLGQMPHPETGQPVCDFDAARMFIDQLEMLAVKTKGNLGKEEEELLKKSLSSARLAFVQAVEGGEKAHEKPAAKPASAGGPPAAPEKIEEPVAKEAAPAASATAAAEAEARKKFVKKY